MMRQHGFHIAMHLMVMGTAVLMWWPIVAGEGRGTRFAPSDQAPSSFKLWLRFAKPAAGRLLVDEGARRAVAEHGATLLAVGVAALSLSVGVEQRWDTQRAQRDAEIQQRVEAEQRARLAAQRPVVPSADERRLQRVRPQLLQPWLPALRAIENATEPPVFLLALSIDPATGRLRLDGEAPSFGEALAYAQRLDEDGALPPAHLLSHELVNDSAGRTTVRFTMVANWSRP